MEEHRAFRAFHFSPASASGMPEYSFQYGSGVVVLDPHLVLRIEDLSTASPTFRRHWDAIIASGFPLTVGTYEAFGMASSSASTGRIHFIPNAENGQTAVAAFIVVNHPFIRRQYEEYFADRTDVPRELVERLITWETMATLGHEIAHMLDVAISNGHFNDYCADPAPRQPAIEACAVRRENLYRGEAGIPFTPYYGLLPPGEALQRHYSRYGESATPPGEVRGVPR